MKSKGKGKSRRKEVLTTLEPNTHSSGQRSTPVRRRSTAEKKQSRRKLKGSGARMTTRRDAASANQNQCAAGLTIDGMSGKQSEKQSMQTAKKSPRSTREFAQRRQQKRTRDKQNLQDGREQNQASETKLPGKRR